MLLHTLFLRLRFVLLLSGCAPVCGQHLHVIYVLEQTDRAYGLLNLGNDQLMTQLVTTVGWGLGYPVSTTYLSNADFSRAALKKTVLSLKTRPQDIILLYYSGFGVVPGTEAGQFANWKLRDAALKGVPVAEVESWLTSKKVHLRLLIADCSAQLMSVPVLSALTGLVPDIRRQVIRKLFLGTCGLVKLGSSIPSVPSWVNQQQTGSVFTNGLHQAFQDLLLITNPANVSLVSFELLRAGTENRVGNTFYRLPYSQKPVLEQRSCRVGVRAAAPPTPPDPLANETLNAWLNAIAHTPDSLQRAQLMGQLLARCPPAAPVQVSRYAPQAPDAARQQALGPPVMYTLTTYLEQLQQAAALAGTAQPLFFHAVSVVDKALDRQAPQPIRRLVLREEWGDAPTPR